jgi:hypothetical protein
VHVLAGHPEISRFIEDVLITVRAPDAITPDRLAGRWRYWQSSTGPSSWLYVVVDWATDEPHVVTAYGKRRGPI